MKSWIDRTVLASALAAGVAFSGAALADPNPNAAQFRSYFGITDMPLGTITGNAATARSGFMGQLLSTSSYGFETRNPGVQFESFTATGTYGPKTFDLDQNDLLFSSNNTLGGRFATDGDFWAEMESSSITLDFAANPLHALGFFMTDLGDFESNVVIELWDTTGEKRTFRISDEAGVVGSTSGSLAFWGFTDNTGATYNKLRLSADLTNDAFGIDGLTTGAVSAPSPVPIPGTLALAAAALGLMVLRRRA